MINVRPSKGSPSDMPFPEGKFKASIVDLAVATRSSIAFMSSSEGDGVGLGLGGCLCHWFSIQSEYRTMAAPTSVSRKFVSFKVHCKNPRQVMVAIHLIRICTPRKFSASAVDVVCFPYKMKLRLRILNLRCGIRIDYAKSEPCTNPVPPQPPRPSPPIQLMGDGRSYRNLNKRQIWNCQRHTRASVFPQALSIRKHDRGWSSNQQTNACRAELRFTHNTTVPTAQD